MFRPSTIHDPYLNIFGIVTELRNLYGLQVSPPWYLEADGPLAGFRTKLREQIGTWNKDFILAISTNQRNHPLTLQL